MMSRTTRRLTAALAAGALAAGLGACSDADSVAEQAKANPDAWYIAGDGSIVEAQLTAEGATFDEEGLLRLLRLARIGCTDIFREQLKAARPKEIKA